MESDSNAALPDVPWQRVHPISLLFVMLSRLRQWVIPAAIALFSATQGGWIIFGLGAFGFAILIVFASVRFLTLQFRLAGGELQIREGILFRSYRTVPTNRIQNIDLVQTVLHRIFRVAEVRIETASGKEPEAILQVLTLAQVERLRESVFARTRSAAVVDLNQVESRENTVDPQTVEQPELLLGITLRQLGLAGLASNRGLLLVPIVLGGLYEARMFSRSRFRLSGDEILERLPQGMSWLFMIVAAILGCIGLFLLLKLFSIAWFVIRFFGYKLWAVGDDLRIECGLLTKVSATIPRSRIQFISIHRTWLGRRLGLAAIRIETAGGGGKENENASQSVGRRWFVPVLAENQVARLVEQLRPGIRWAENEFEWRSLSPRAGSRLQRVAVLVAIVLTIVAASIWRPWGAVAGLVALPCLIWWARRQAQAMRYARVGPLIVYRSGLMTRKCSCTFLDKIQTIRLSESPFDRRWRMATLAIDTAAAGPAEHRIEVRYLDSQFAELEFADLRASASA